MTESTCCDDFARASALSRRRFLQGMAAAGGVTVATSVFGGAVRQAAFADTIGGAATGNVLVVLSLRGGLDGMGLVVPHGDPAYYTARPTIAVPKASVLQPDAMFGLHPQLKPLEWLFSAGELAAVHAAGLPAPNRSHFSAMEEIEEADPTSPERRGWVNRMVGLDLRDDPVEAVHLTSSMAPTLVAGPAPTLAATRLNDISLIGADPRWDDQTWRNRRNDSLRMVWDNVSAPLGAATRSTMSAIATVGPVAAAKYVPDNGVTYPDDWPATDLANALRDTAHLIRADIGTEVVSIDYGSWDLHNDYGTLEWGQMQSLIGGFAGALDAFMRDLGELRSKVTVVTISEFGRRLQENGNRGLDHGWGNVMLVAGGGVKGGRYYGTWPGLGNGSLADGDLAVTTDYRNVLGEIVERRFNRAPSLVWPGISYARLGLMS